MKGRIAFGLAILVALAGCATMGQPPYQWTHRVDEPYGDGLVQVAVLHPEGAWTLLDGSGLSGVVISIRNDSGQPLVVDWNKSALEYNGNSHRVFLSGQKYIDAGRNVPDRVIGSGSQLQIGVYDADAVDYAEGDYGGWKMRPFRTDRLSCLICMRVRGEERFYTAVVDLQWAEESGDSALFDH